MRYLLDSDFCLNASHITCSCVMDILHLSPTPRPLPIPVVALSSVQRMDLQPQKRLV